MRHHASSGASLMGVSSLGMPRTLGSGYLGSVSVSTSEISSCAYPVLERLRHRKSIVPKDEKVTDHIFGAHFMWMTHAQLLVSWAASGNDFTSDEGRRGFRDGVSAGVGICECTCSQLHRKLHARAQEHPTYVGGQWGRLGRMCSVPEGR